MIPKYTAFIKKDDGEEIYGPVMYLIVWEGKALSGSETLVRGDEITEIKIGSVMKEGDKLFELPEDMR